MPERREGLVLYVRAPGVPEDDVIPFGLIGLMNAVTRSKLGVFANELSVDLVRGAAVILMDVHWLHTLGPARALSRAIRRIQPRVPIVVGGYTATILADAIVADGFADYVIVGDAEGAFPLLLDALVQGGDLAGVPNLVYRGARTAQDYRLTSEDFDRFDYSSIDWFPSLDARVRLNHASATILTKNPVVVSYKGCRPRAAMATPYCQNCYGQPRTQNLLMRRNLIHRSAARVGAELQRLSRDSRTKKVYIFDDPIAVIGEDFFREVLSAPLDLALYMEPYRFFSVELLHHMAKSFREVELVFYHEDLAALVAAEDPFALSFLGAAKADGIRVGICVVDPPTNDLRELARARGVELYDNAAETFDLPAPGTSGPALSLELERFADYSNRFLAFKLLSGIAPTYLDAIAVQLGLADETTPPIESWLPASVRDRRCRLPQNALERQLMAGANSLDLTFWAAPFSLPRGRPFVPFSRLERTALHASPVAIEAFSFEIGTRTLATFEIPFDFARAGTPDGVAINFVSAGHEAMRELSYEGLWKLCLPLHSKRSVKAGERAWVRGTIDLRLDAPLDVRLELI
jgi:hypothetical protein